MTVHADVKLTQSAGYQWLSAITLNPLLVEG